MKASVHVRIRDIIRAASQITTVPIRDIVGDGRFSHIIAARFAVYFVARHAFHRTSAEIGRAVNRDPSTVASGIGAAKARLDEGMMDWGLIERVEARAWRCAAQRTMRDLHAVAGMEARP